MWGSVQPFVDYAKKYGDIVLYKLANEGKHVLLSNPQEASRVLESDKYLVSDKKEYHDYTYGRLVGQKNGKPFTSISNSRPADLDAWRRQKSILQTSLSADRLALLSQYVLKDGSTFGLALILQSSRRALLIKTGLPRSL